MMKYRMTFMAGAAVGYVLGAKAGRERYDQIRNLARRVMDNPQVQDAVGTARTQAGDIAHKARDMAKDRAESMRERAKDAETV